MKKLNLSIFILITLLFVNISYGNIIENIPSNFITKYTIVHDYQETSSVEIDTGTKHSINTDKTPLILKYNDVERLRPIAEQFKYQRLIEPYVNYSIFETYFHIDEFNYDSLNHNLISFNNLNQCIIITYRE
jgi:hypothetical protein